MAGVLKMSPMVAPFLVDARDGLKKLQQISGKISKFAGNAGVKMQSAGRALTTGLTVPILGAGAAAVKFATDANRGMANVATLIPGQTARIAELRGELQRLAVESGTDFNVLSDGLYQTISALGDTEQTMRALTIANKASKAGIAETKDAINLLSGVSSAYGDTSDAMLGRISDLAFTTVKLGVTTFPELAESMGKTSTLAKTMGVSLEQLFGNYAALTSGTDGTAEVSTRLAAVMGALMQGGNGLNDVYEKLGAKSATELIAKTGGLNEALFALKDAVGGDVNAFTQLFGRKEAQLAALQLTGEKAGEAAREIAAMGQAAGATDEAYRAQTEGINAAEQQFKVFVEQLKAVARAFGDKIIPVLSRFGEKVLTPLVDKLGALTDGEIESALKYGAMIAAIGPGLSILGKAFSAVSVLSGALGAGAGGLSAVLAVITGPVGIALAAVAALTAAFVLFRKELQPVTDAVKGEFTKALEGMKAPLTDTSKGTSNLMTDLRELVTLAAPVWGFFAKFAAAVALAPLKDFVDRVKRIYSTFQSIVRIGVAVKETFGTIFETVVTDLANKFPKVAAVFQSIGDAFRWAGEGIKMIVDNLSKLKGSVVGGIVRRLGINLDGGLADNLANQGARGAEFVEGKTKERAMELNVKVDAPPGAKVGVASKGLKAQYKDRTGAIMPEAVGI